MRRVLLAAVAGSVIAAACGTVPEAPPREPEAERTEPAPPPMNALLLPARTHIQVELTEPVGTSMSRVGDVIAVRVAEAVVALNGDTVVPVNASITGMVTGVQRGDNLTPAVRLNFLRTRLRDVNHPLAADVVGTGLAPEAEPATERDAQPARGVIIRGDLRLHYMERLGVGAGTLISLGPGGDALPAGTRLTIRTIDTLNLQR